MGPGWWGCLGTALLAASPARGGFAGTQGLRRPTRSWETRRASRSPSSISVCCRMWRLHSPWAGNARGRSAGGGVSLGHDPTAVGMGTGQVRDYSQQNPHPQPHSWTQKAHALLPPSSQASQPCSRQLPPGSLLPRLPPSLPNPEERSVLMHTHPASVHLDSPQTGWRCLPPG